MYFYSASALLTMPTAVLARADCPFVRLSVRHVRCFDQMNEDMIARSLTSGRTIILVSGEVKFIRIFAGGHPSENVEVKRPPVASENLTNNQTSRKRCKISG